MGTLKVDNIQTESGSAVITNGVIPSTLVSGIGMVKLFQGSATSAASYEINSTYINSTYDNYIMFIDCLLYTSPSPRD